MHARLLPAYRPPPLLGCNPCQSSAETRKTAPTISRDLVLQHVVYVESERHVTVEALRAAFTRCNAIDEYCFEIMKVGKLRELKRRRFLRAMFAAGFSSPSCS